MEPVAVGVEDGLGVVAGPALALLRQGGAGSQGPSEKRPENETDQHCRPPRPRRRGISSR